MGVEEFYFTDDVVFRLGACQDGNHNSASPVKIGFGAREFPSDLIRLEERHRQSGASVMAYIGLCFWGGGFHFAPKGLLVDAEE